MSSEYRALVAKVEAFTRPTSERRRDDMMCRAGCESCCHAWLTLSPVEAEELRAGLAALPPTERAEVAARGRHELAREARGEPDARCALLGSDGRCAVYEQRPLVCRTQGHALRYPSGFVPEAAVRAKVAGGEVTYCPLNYERAAPQAADVLDAERVDQLLALINHRFALARGLSPDTRTSISELASEADMLVCSESGE